jgi:uncharacterized protein with GYD domain
MAKFVVFFTFKGETIKALMSKPSDRAAAVREMAGAAGGQMEAYYLMFGTWDGMVIIDVPDSRTAAAVSLATASSGAFARLETHELIEPSELPDLLGRASELNYAPPGT